MKPTFKTIWRTFVATTIFSMAMIQSANAKPITTARICNDYKTITFHFKKTYYLDGNTEDDQSQQFDLPPGECHDVNFWMEKYFDRDGMYKDNLVIFSVSQTTPAFTLMLKVNNDNPNMLANSDGSYQQVVDSYVYQIAPFKHTLVAVTPSGTFIGDNTPKPMMTIRISPSVLTYKLTP